MWNGCFGYLFFYIDEIKIIICILYFDNLVLFYIFIFNYNFINILVNIIFFKIVKEFENIFSKMMLF